MATHDRVAEWTIAALGDDSDITQVLSSLKGKFQSAVNDLERISNQADLFSTLQKKVTDIQAAIDANTRSARDFKAQIDQITAAGGKVGDDLQKSLALTEKAGTSLNTQLAATAKQLATVKTNLTDAGFQTDKFAASQTKLAVATAEASAALEVQSAKSALGLKTFADVEPQIAALNTAFLTLKNSGTLTANEIAQAERLAEQQTAALLAGVTNLPGVFEKAGAAGASAFDAIGGKTLLAVAGIASVAEGIKTIVTASNDFAQGLGKIGSITGLTDEQLRALGDSARSLAKDIGVDVNDALKQLYEIIKSTNLGSEDALTVLDVSAKAAKVTFTDLNTVTKVSADLISAFGINASDLSKVLDGIYASSKAGGPSFADLAGHIGSLSVVAKSAGVSVSDMTALLNVMSSASGDGAGSVGELQKILVKFDTQKVRDELRAMGITTTDVTEVIKELTARGNVNLNTLLDLGVASSKSAVGVAALTRSSDDLSLSFARQAEAIGQVAVGLQKVNELPKDAFEKLAASLKDLSISSGVSDFFTAFVEGFTKANVELAENIRLLRERKDVLAEAQQAQLQYNNEAQTGAASEQLVADGIAQTNDELRKFRQLEDLGFGKGLAEDAKAAVDAIAKANAEIAKFRDSLGGTATALTDDAKALNDATGQLLAQVTKLADEEIAQLDRSAKAQSATAKATFDIQTKAAGDRLKIISDNEIAVRNVTDEAIAAREAALRKTTDNETKIQGELAKIRISSIAPTIAAYQSEYDTLTAQLQNYAGKETSIQQARLTFNEGIEKQLFDIRIGKLSFFDQYVAKSEEADRLISLSREAAARGDSTNAEKYGNEAIAVAKELGVTYSANGSIIVTQSQAAADKLKILNAVSESVNASFDKAGDDARAGYVLTQVYISRVQLALNDLRDTQKENQKLAADGLQVKIALDQASFLDYMVKIAEATAPRTVTVTIKTVNEQGQPVAPPSGAGFARGGHVPQRFASGGSVFRALASHKVPGSGSGDIVPALLPVGSFVMRKAAAGLYGDGVMGQLARFAAGGWVPPPGPASPWIGSGASPLSNADQMAQISALHELKVQSDVEIYAMLSRAVGLPPAKTGQDVRDYIGRVRELILADDDITDVTALLDRLVRFYNRFYPAIETSKDWHVPLVMGIGVTADPNPATAGTPATKTGGTGLPPKPGDAYPIFGIGNPFGFAAGGPVGAIPALVEPGEYILQPAAVANIERMWGGGFLDAANAMRIPKGFLDGAFNLEAPRRYATGGYVDGPWAPAISMSGNSSGGSLTVNVYPQRFDERTFNDEIVPRFNKLVRSSK